MLGPTALGTLCSFQSHWSRDLTQPSWLQPCDGGSASPLFTEGVEVGGSWSQGPGDPSALNSLRSTH